MRTYTPDTGLDARHAEDIGLQLVQAKLRLDEELASNCASKNDIAFWRAEVLRLDQELNDVGH